MTGMTCSTNIGKKPFIIDCAEEEKNKQTCKHLHIRQCLMCTCIGNLTPPLLLIDKPNKDSKAILFDIEFILKLKMAD